MRKRMRRAKAIARFEEACAILNELAAAGYELYAASSLHLMKGPSHVFDRSSCKVRARRDNIVHTVIVRTLSGGDW